MYTLTTAHLAQLCALNEFPVDSEGLIFFGLRGCLPLHPFDQAFRAEHALTAAEVDHLHPRCTLIQWLPGEGTFAVYPGSTVPHRVYIEKARARGWRGANELLTGYFADYRKGIHRASTPRRHEAFLQTSVRPFWRTTDDLDYGLEDPVDIDLPGDNLHAAWCAGVEAERFASAGCQVVVGFPQCPARGDQPGTGPWKAFHAAAYACSQNTFGYVLINGADARRLAVAGQEGMERVRFGSWGTRAQRVQEALRQKGFYEGQVDGDFGARSLRALLEFQTHAFGPHADDGVCGPQTAEALGIAWP